MKKSRVARVACEGEGSREACRRQRRRDIGEEAQRSGCPRPARNPSGWWRLHRDLCVTPRQRCHRIASSSFLDLAAQSPPARAALDIFTASQDDVAVYAAPGGNVHAPALAMTTPDSREPGGWGGVESRAGGRWRQPGGRRIKTSPSAAHLLPRRAGCYVSRGRHRGWSRTLPAQSFRR